MTKRLSKTAIDSSGLKENSAENYTPTFMKDISAKTKYNNLKKPMSKPVDMNMHRFSQDTEDESNDESMDVTSNSSAIVGRDGNVHVYNDI